MSVDSQALKFGAVHGGRAIVADFADVAGAQTPLLACRHRGCYLSAGQDVGRAKFDLRSQSRIVRKTNQCVGGVQPDTDQVNLGRLIHDKFN